MTAYVYERITSRATKSGPCAVCGKRAQRSETFENTVNPWNRNEDGTVRTRSEIRAHVDRLAEAWRAEPVVHAGCEAAA